MLLEGLIVLKFMMYQFTFSHLFRKIETKKCPNRIHLLKIIRRHYFYMALKGMNSECANIENISFVHMKNHAGYKVLLQSLTLFING